MLSVPIPSIHGFDYSKGGTRTVLSSGVSVSGARAFLPSIGDILCPRQEKYGTRKTGIRGICDVVL